MPPKLISLKCPGRRATFDVAVVVVVVIIIMVVVVVVVVDVCWLLC